MGAEGVHESVHAADPVEVNRDIRSSQPGQKKLFECINPIKKGLKINHKPLFKSSSLISGLGFLLFFFFQSV